MMMIVKMTTNMTTTMIMIAIYAKTPTPTPATSTPQPLKKPLPISIRIMKIIMEIPKEHCFWGNKLVKLLENRSS